MPPAEKKPGKTEATSPARPTTITTKLENTHALSTALCSLAFGSYDLQLEELVVVQPYQLVDHTGKSQQAHVEVAMSNCESIDGKYSGLQVDFVELRPFTGSNENQRKH